MTAYLLQGKTLPAVILDVRGARGIYTNALWMSFFPPSLNCFSYDCHAVSLHRISPLGEGPAAHLTRSGPCLGILRLGLCRTHVSVSSLKLPDIHSLAPLLPLCGVSYRSQALKPWPWESTSSVHIWTCTCCHQAETLVPDPFHHKLNITRGAFFIWCSCTMLDIPVVQRDAKEDTRPHAMHKNAMHASEHVSSWKICNMQPHTFSCDPLPASTSHSDAKVSFC